MIVSRKWMPGHAANPLSRDGHNLLRAILDTPDEYPEIVSLVVKLILSCPRISIADAIMSGASELGELPTTVMSRLAQDDHVGDVISPDVLNKHLDGIIAALDDPVSTLAQHLTRSESFMAQLRDLDINMDQVDMHDLLCAADGLTDSRYKKHIFTFLQELDHSIWEEELLSPGTLYGLLTTCVSSGFNATTRIADAAESISKRICEPDSPDRTWRISPPNWQHVRGTFSDARRTTIADNIVDSLAQTHSTDLRPLVGLFGAELSRVFAKQSDEAFLRKYVTPIVADRDDMLLTWLLETLEHGHAFWDAASEDNQETFRLRLYQSIEDAGDEDIVKQLHEIRVKLGIATPPEPAEDTDTENGTDTEAESDDADDNAE